MGSQTNEVLYIEDDSSNMLVMRHLFRRKLAPLSLLEAVTVEEGVDRARIMLPCLILMDLKFSGMDGFDGLVELRGHSATRFIPVWAVTACVLDEDVERAKRAGFDEYIKKPIEMPAFISRVQTHLGTLG